MPRRPVPEADSSRACKAREQEPRSDVAHEIHQGKEIVQGTAHRIDVIREINLHLQLSWCHK